MILIHKDGQPDKVKRTVCLSCHLPDCSGCLAKTAYDVYDDILAHTYWREFGASKAEFHERYERNLHQEKYGRDKR